MIFAWHWRHDHTFALGQHRGGEVVFGIAGAQMTRLGRLGTAALQQPLGVSGCDPAAFLGDADGNDFVLVLVDCVQHRGRRQQRDFVLAAAPAEQDTYPEFLHASILTPESWK